jgi:glycerol-3-phosphate O-acyltransferase 3/4
MINVFEDSVMFMNLAIQAISQDEFTKCFEPRNSKMSWSPMKSMMTVLSLVTRYLVLFPIRLGFLLLTSVFFFILLYISSRFKSSRLKRKLFLFQCKCWTLCISADIRYHGEKPILKEPHIFVSNHTSYVDFIILSSHKIPHASLSQIHGGAFGYIQRNILTFVGSLSFHRDEKRDRSLIVHKILAHSNISENSPILAFPEGTCVNNEYTVMFHKGVFELGLKICPVAIKYDKSLLDPYWNTRESSFLQHAIYLMTRWKMVVDVWWIQPQTIEPGETATRFADRVKSLISSNAGLIDLSWNGYLKNFTSTTEQMKLLRRSQASYTKMLEERLSIHRTYNKNEEGTDQVSHCKNE